MVSKLQSKTQKAHTPTQWGSPRSPPVQDTLVPARWAALLPLRQSWAGAHGGPSRVYRQWVTVYFNAIIMQIHVLAFFIFSPKSLFLLCALQVIPSQCWLLKVSLIRPCRCPSSPSAASTPPLWPFWPLNLRIWTLDLPSLTSVDLTGGVMQSSVWRKDLSYRSPAHSDIWEEKEERGKAQDTSIIMGFYFWGQEYPPAATHSLSSIYH